jgi:GcrA cell cycle regulator
MIAHQLASTSVAWTADRNAKLRELHALGLSASQMAKLLGGVTRNAVIGKCNRMGLGPIGGGKASAPAQYRRTPVKPAKPRSPKGVMVLARQGGPTQRNPAENKIANLKANAEAREKPAPSVIERARAFLPLEGREPVQFGSPGCKWPVGGEGADMRCCGSERVDGKPYCADHGRLAFVKPPPAKAAARKVYHNSGGKKRWAA